MTINVEALIICLGKSYAEIVDARLMPYKTKPKGYSGSSVLHLKMLRAGLFLTFLRVNKMLYEIDVDIQREEQKSWVFPGELPAPFMKSMSHQWIRSTFGEPDKIAPAKICVGTAYGSRDLYKNFAQKEFQTEINLTVIYDRSEPEMVRMLFFILPPKPDGNSQQ